MHIRFESAIVIGDPMPVKTTTSEGPSNESDFNPGWVV